MLDTRFLSTSVVSLLLALASFTALRAEEDSGTDAAIGLLELMLDLNPDAAVGPLDAIRNKLSEGNVTDSNVPTFRERLAPLLAPLVKDFVNTELHRSALLLSGQLAIPEALPKLSELALSDSMPAEQRADCIRALGSFGSDRLSDLAAKLLAQDIPSPAVHEAIVDATASLNLPDTGVKLLDLYPKVVARAQPRIVDILSGRKAWAKLLLESVENQSIPKTAIGANQAARIKALGDQELSQKLTSVWGSIRTERDPKRLEVITRVEKLIKESQGADVHRGAAIFRKVCAQCHKLHGEGHDVGPEITRNGRGSFSQLLSNVLDPNLVIGTGFISRTILTLDGRVVSGILTEETDDRLVLKIQGGKLESISRDDIDTESMAGLSLMPEGLETQLSEKELIDLFALLTLELPPESPENKLIPGTPNNLHQ